MRKRIILSAVLTMVLCFCLIGGATFALFTSESSVNIAVTSGKVDVEAEIKDLEVYSMDVLQTATDNDGNGLFENGGIAKYDATKNELSLVNVAPGDKVEFNIVVANNSNIDIQYKITWEATGELDEALVKYVVNNQVKEDLKNVDWTEWKYNPQDLTKTIKVGVELPISVGNEYQEKSANISFKFEAIQANGVKYLTVEWDGTSDTTWYNDTDTEFKLNNPAQLAGLADLVDGGNNFAGKTIKLERNFDLGFTPEGATEPKSFDPIGDDSPFAGTFDGQGHTISNLYQSGWAFGYEWGSYGSIGLFGEVESATIKNVTLSGFECQVEGGDVGGICGSATGTCVFENITLEDSTWATYNNGNGGIIGWSGAGDYTFKDITIKEDVVLAGLWGSFDSSIGGVVGQGEPGATYRFENVNVACRLDVYNDCTASYDYYNYRMCGMLIGRLQETTTIAGVNYPDTSKYNIICNNVTVTYGEWANYHYCEPTPGLNGGRGMRVEAGYSYAGLPADYDHSQCVDNHMNLIPFDQVFGGDQLAVKGLKEYTGVTVVYNNK